VAEIKLIIAGVDGSKESRAALHWAYDEAIHHGASLTVVMTWHPPVLPMSPPYGAIPEEGYEHQPRTTALGVLDGLVAELEERIPPVDVRTSIEEGSPAKVLIERSKECDLMVVGHRGQGGFAGMLLGSVSQHLVAHAHCPVVVVR
jgi:nucleotide-binding universal stress UspA family protein